ncbi:MAG: phosphoribosyltransferase [Candidatus Helarchaeota archaeon]
MFHDRIHVYRDRSHAGNLLADIIQKRFTEDIAILAIPNGGVPVALPIYKRFQQKDKNTQFYLLIVRKLPIPFNTEAGFGAITLDGTVILNEPLVARIGLNEPQIQTQISLVMAQMKQRLKEYGLSKQKFEIKNKNVLLVDDGLASGFTMIAAIKSIQKFHLNKIVVAIPTAPQSSIDRITPLVDEIICPNIRNTRFYAVADAYQYWHDLEISEVHAMLQKANLITLNSY